MTTEVISPHIQWFRRQQKLLRDIATGTIYSPEQAQVEFGLDVGEGWQVKIEDYEPTTRMASFTYITPEGWQIKPDESQVSPEGWTFRDIQRSPEGEVIDYTVTLPTGETYKYSDIARPEVAPPITPAFEPAFAELSEDYKLLYREYQRTGGRLDIPSWTKAGAPIRPITEIDDEFLRDLYTRATIGDAEATLSTLLEGATREDGTLYTHTEIQQVISEVTSFFVSEEERVTQLTSTIGAVFPGYDIEDFEFMIEDHPDEFISRIQEGGRTPEKVALLTSVLGMPLSSDDPDIIGVEDVFPEVVPGMPGAELFQQALPLLVRETNKDAMLTYFFEDPDALRRALIGVGRNAETEALVKTLYPLITQKGLGQYFNPRVPGTVEGVEPTAIGALPTRTWLDRVGEAIDDPLKLIPFVSSGKEIVDIALLMKTAKDLEDGKEVSKEDLLALKAYVDRATMDTSWGYEVADVIAQLVPFAGEFIATGGIFSAGKTATVKAGEAALKRIATRTGLRILEGKLARYGVEVAGTLVGGTLRTIPAGVTRIPASTLEKQLQATLTGDEEAVWQSALKAFGEQWVEVVSESTGGLFAPLTSRIKGQLVKLGLFKAFMKANPTATANDLRRILDKVGYHGVLEEMLEERVADVGHGILEPLGLSDQKFSFPSLRQLSVELVAFSVPGGAAMAIQTTPSIMEKLSPKVKEALRIAAEEAQARPERGAIGGVPEGFRTMPLEEVSKLETRIPIDLIRKDEANEIARLTEDIKINGITEPIVIRVREDGSQIVWDGIHRLIVAQDLGIKDIPIRYIGDEGLAVGRPPTPTVTPPVGEGIPTPVTPEPTPPVTEAEKPALAEYYRKEAQRWREIADQETRKEPSKEGEQRYATAIQKAEGFEKQLSELEARPPVAREVVEAPLTLVDTPPETTLPQPDNVNVSEDRVVRPPPPPKEPPPPEPPATHPPQPAPIEEGRLVMPDLQASQDVVDMYSKPDLWRRIANLPLVKKAVGVFNPAAVANDPARQALILRAALKDEAAQKAQAVISHVWEIGTQDRIWGKTNEMGLLTKEPFVGTPLGDILRNPDKYSAQMTPQQREWVKRFGEVDIAKLDALKRNEVEINELSFEDGGRYSDRRVMGKFNDSGELIESGRIASGGRVGAKQPFEKTRIFATEAQGIEAGYRYMNSDEALYYNTIGAYYKIADKQMAEWILTKVDWRTTAAPETLKLQAESARLRLRKAQQLLGALNRAVRGERVPSSTINSIASAFPDQADTLKTLIPELQKPSPETADIVKILDAEAKALISEARGEYAQAVDKRARAREEALRVKYEEASIAHPAFQGKIFTDSEAKEIADILTRGLQPHFSEALGAVNKVNALARFFMLAGDMSPMAIQLQFLAFYRPKAYGKAWGGFVKAFFNPEFQYRYYANHRDLINRHPTLILSGRGTEFTEFMGRGGLGQKLGVLAKPLVPFQKAFEGCLDVAGIELAKSLDHRCINPETTLEVDQFINEFRGVTSSARIGVGSTQRQIETNILLAPRYNRAIAGYLFDFVHGGVRGELARMSLAQGLAGVAALAVAISIALGEDEDEIWQHFDPTSPKFFTWDVKGVKIGLGGKVRSVIKTFGNMLRTGEVGEPAMRFLRGNLSPAASTSVDLITGRNYIGEPTRDNVLDFSKNILENFMMIWTQNLLLEGGTLQDKAIIATAEFFGLRGYDISARKEMKIEELEELLGEQVGKFPTLTTKKPNIYDGKNIYADIKRLLQYIPPEDVLADKGYAGLGHTVIRIEQSEANTLLDIALKDYDLDKTDEYMRQWAERVRITEAGERATYTRVRIVEGKEERTEFKGLSALIAHKTDYPKAQLGNLSRRQRELLLEYNVVLDKKQFIKDNPNMKLNPQIEWFKAHPKENAEFAIFGQAKIYTKEAYNELQALLKEWDWPDAAIPALTMPPEGSVENYFEREQAVEDFGAMSAEAQIVLARDEALLEWFGLDKPEQPERYYELKVKNRAEREHWDTLKDKDSPDYIEDEDERRTQFYKEFPDSEYFDDEARCEAIANDFSDEQIEAWVERSRLVQKYSAGSPKVKEWAFNNPEAYKKALGEKMLTDKGGLPEDDRGHYEEWVEPAIRIQADETFIEEDAYWDELGDKDKPDIYIADETKRRAKFLERFPDSVYFDNVERIDAYKAGFTEKEAELWADRGRTIGKFEAGSSEALVWLLDHWDVYEQAIDADLLTDRREELRKREPVLRINVDYASQDEEYNAIETADERKDYLFPDGEATDYCIARYTRKSYEDKIPEGYREDYITWFTDLSIKEKPEDYPTGVPYWEDNWWMLEHRGYHDEVWVGILDNQSYPMEIRTNADGVQYLIDMEGKPSRTPPTRGLGAKYLEYIRISRGDIKYTNPDTGLEYESKGQGADQYRIDNLDMDEWGVVAGVWTKTMTEKRKQLGETPGERAERVAQDLIDWFKEEQEKIREEALR